ncbi:MAG: carbon storage regulator [Planctomycetota bacterium]
MLVLSRRRSEQIDIADGLIVITIVEIRGDKVRIGIDAPKDIAVNRREITQMIERADAEMAEHG